MRTVLYGHAAYYASEGKCTIPADTTLTLYAPSGALLDKAVADALANGEHITNKDLEAVKDVLFFIGRRLDVPADGNPELLNAYPLVLNAGDEVPNFFLIHAPIPESKTTLFHTISQTVNVVETTDLSDLLERYKGHDLHWGACSFAKEPNAESIGYGYGYKFKKESPLNKHYAEPPLSEEVKKKKRAERFGTVVVSSSSSTFSSHEVQSDQAQPARYRSYYTNRRGDNSQRRHSEVRSEHSSLSRTHNSLFRSPLSERNNERPKPHRYSPYSY